MSPSTAELTAYDATDGIDSNSPALVCTAWAAGKFRNCSGKDASLEARSFAPLDGAKPFGAASQSCAMYV